MEIQTERTTKDPDITVRRFDEIEYFHHGAYGRLRAELGIRSFGIQVVRMEAGSEVYPEHDHVEDGQEEVYLTLMGRATLRVGDQEIPLEPNTAVRVGPRETRTVITSDVPVWLVVVGGVPGQVYTPSPYTELGAALAVASASPTETHVGDEVTFDGSDSSTGAGADSLSFAWDFDGTDSYVEASPRTTHRYSQAGNYTAKLRVTDTAGHVDIDKVRIHVHD